MYIIFAYYRFGELDSVSEGFENFASSEQYLASRRWNEPYNVVSFIGESLDACWDALFSFTHPELCAI